MGNCVLWLGANVPGFSAISPSTSMSNVVQYCLPRKKHLIIFDHREDAMGFRLKYPALSTELVEKDRLIELKNEIPKH